MLMEPVNIKAFLKEKIANSKEYVLITGGAGYIGHHLIDYFLESDLKIRVLDNFTFKNENLFSKRYPGVEVINGDITNANLVQKALENVKVVVALAAVVGDPACSVDAVMTYSINYNSTRILVDLCNLNDIERLLFASSCSVYGESLGNEFLNESSNLNPVSSYAYSRIASEKYIIENYNYNYTILRLSTVYGLSQRMRYDLVVNLLASKCYYEKSAKIFGGEQWRPFIHCKDVAKAFFEIAISKSSKVFRQIFNVGSTDENYKLKELRDIFLRVLPTASIDIVTEDIDNRNYKVSFEKIKNTIGFNPNYALEQGIIEMIDFFNQCGAIDINADVYSNYRTFKGIKEADYFYMPSKKENGLLVR